MNQTPQTGPLSEEERNALFATWLKPIPLALPRDTMVSRVAPWRHQFTDAIAQGYSWAQLAKEVAPKPEIGVQTTPEHLRKCIRLAFARANEPMPHRIDTRKRRQHATTSTTTQK